VEIPHTQSGAWPEVRADRFASRIQTGSADGCALALIGLPHDVGVALNGGRPGARFGPAAFRAALARSGSAFDVARGRGVLCRVFDAGDVVPHEGNDEGAVLATHERVAEALEAVHELGLIPICIGGGHDLTYPAVRALAEGSGGRLGGLNVDAHLDVREAVGSGMPFRSLIEAGCLDPVRFSVLGAGRFANAREHTDYLLTRGARIDASLDGLAGGAGVDRALERMGAGASFVTIDLDSIDASQAPGVSAPNACGLCVRDALAVAERAGRDSRIGHMDIMELNPLFDDPAWEAQSATPGRTARIAALIAMTFISAFEGRPS